MQYEVKNLVKKYQAGDEQLFALNNVSLTIKENEINTILGPSGSGKTTLLNMLGAIDQVDSGEILFHGEDIAFLNEKKKSIYRRNNTGFIFQSYNLISTLSILENIELGAYLSKNPLDVELIIKELGLSEHKNKFPYQLSGGQQQRVAIARVVVKNPKVIFCDEPTGALDEKAGRKILNILQKLNEKYKTTLIMVTHNPNIADMSHQVIHFNSGKIVNIIKNEHLKSAYEIDWS